jgi:predicted nucleic acid-binding protein
MDHNLDRVFLDAGYLIARLNRGDQYHQRARSIEANLTRVRQFWTTEAVLLEVMASLASPPNRALSVGVWDEFHGGDERCRLVAASPANLQESMTLYRARPDKHWSLTDCFSFIGMEREGLGDALTADQHFVQAGFRALLLE